MILRNPLTSPVRGARQKGHAPSRAFGWTQKAIYAGSILISQDAGYQGDDEDFQPERQLIRRLLYSPTTLTFFFFELYTIGLLSKEYRPFSFQAPFPYLKKLSFFRCEIEYFVETHLKDLQAVCDTPMAHITSCVSSLMI